MTPTVRIALAAGLAGALLAGAGAANAVAFESRAMALENDWRAAEAAGLAPDLLAPARASLREVRSRRVGPLPYSILSGAVLVDPFERPRSLAIGAAGQRAEHALARVREIGGPRYETRYRQQAAALRRERQVSELQRLAARWEAEADQLAGARDQLAQVSGGLDEAGQPRDVVQAMARLRSVSSGAQQSAISAEPAGTALEHGEAYLLEPYPELLARHEAMMRELRSAADAVQRRIETRSRADELMGRLADLVAVAARYGAAAYQARADTSKAAVHAAVVAQDDARLEQATAELQKLVDEIRSAIAAAKKREEEAALAAARAGANTCIEGLPSKLIVIRLGAQQLVAYDDGCPFLRTPVTTGRPELPTPAGTYAVQAKFPSYKMVSPWPEDSPYWYPTVTVNWALRFRADGYFMHSAEWQPASTYGPGSDRGPYASHGCVHVQNGPLQQLFAWAPVGTTVIVTT